MNFDQPVIGVGVCIVKDGKVLLHKRKSKHANGRFAFPGGHLEKNESLKYCALREVKEEAGNIVVANLRLWTLINAFFPDEDKHYLVPIMICKYIHGEPEVMEPDKNEFWNWYDWSDLPSPLMPGIEKLKELFPEIPENINTTIIEVST